MSRTRTEEEHLMMSLLTADPYECLEIKGQLIAVSVIAESGQDLDKVKRIAKDKILETLNEFRAMIGSYVDVDPEDFDDAPDHIEDAIETLYNDYFEFTSRIVPLMGEYRSYVVSFTVPPVIAETVANCTHEVEHYCPK